MDWKTELFASSIDLLPVLVGAMIAWVAGIFGAKYSHRLQSSAAQDAELRKKLEELVYQCSEIEYWAEKQEHHYLYGDRQELIPNPVSKINVIASLYFSEIELEAQKLNVAVGEYRLHLMKSGRKSSGKEARPMSEEEVKSWREKYLAMREAKEKLEQSARDLMETLLTEKHSTNGWFRRWFGKSRRN